VSRASIRKAFIGVSLAAALIGEPLCAQEIEPRAYSPGPVRTRFVITGYARSDGEILFDPAAPLSDVKARIDSMIVGYGTSVSMLGRAANFSIVTPYVWGDVSGNVGEDRHSVTRGGIGDTRLRFSMQFMGGQALPPAEFSRHHPRAVLGASLTVVAPTGEYLPDKLVNISANRWAIKPEIGLAKPLGRWLAEGSVGVWLFEDNDEYLRNKVREQDPLTAVQINVSYLFRPRLWAAVGGTFIDGGRTTLDGIPADNRQSNSRIGATLSIPISAHQTVKLAASTGTTTRFGGEFDTYGLFWMYAWTAQRDD
jgi:Putative MetA-pathway of phenol degradation